MLNLRIKMHRLFWVCCLLFVTVGCDQMTKAVARDTLQNLRTFSFFSNTVVFQYAENKGAFLSLGAHLPENIRFLIFTFAVSLFLGFSLFLLFQKNNMDKWTILSLSLLTGGGIGNLIDRMFHGKVTDFVHIGYGSIRTGIFNVADVAIVAGFSIYLILSLVNMLQKRSI